jgi:IS5 family transposase
VDEQTIEQFEADLSGNLSETTVSRSVLREAGGAIPPAYSPFLQHWFNLSDPGVEEALYDSAVLRQFVGIDLGQEAVPDETTVCKFRHLLEEHDLGGEMLETVNLHLQDKGTERHRYHRGRDHYPCSQLDQEPGGEA